MTLYLMRHGEYIPQEVDPDCPLSARGEKEVRRVAAAAAERGTAVVKIYHSGKKRAEQTAAVCADYLAPDGGIEQRAGLNPHDDIFPLLELVTTEDNIMIVGHLPFLEKLVAYLLTGRLERAVVGFTAATLLCLSGDDERDLWKVEWIISP